MASLRFAWLSVVFLLALACSQPAEHSATDTATATLIPPPPPARSESPHNQEQPTTFAPPLLWEIEHKGGPSYLFGTMHVGVDADRDVHPLVWKKLAASKSVALEMLSTSMTTEQTLEILQLPEGVSLKDSLNDGQWKTLVASTGRLFPEETLQRTSPLMLSIMITSTWVTTNGSVDMAVEQRARGAGSKLIALETFEEAREFTSIPQHARYLGLMLDDLEKSKLEFETMFVAYKRGDADALERAVFSSENIEEYPRLYEQLFFQRNKRWIPRIEAIVAEGPALIAVGAGHLLTERGVVALLSKRGYKIRRIGGGTAH